MKLTKKRLKQIIKEELEAQMMGSEIEDFSELSPEDIIDPDNFKVQSPEHRAVIAFSNRARDHVRDLTGGDMSEESITDVLVDTYNMDRHKASEWAFWMSTMEGLK